MTSTANESVRKRREIPGRHIMIYTIAPRERNLFSLQLFEIAKEKQKQTIWKSPRNPAYHEIIQTHLYTISHDESECV